MSFLRCESLDVGIGGIQVVTALDFEIASGEFWGLLGPNGIGKTTLLKCLAGLEEPAAGEVLLEGAPIATLPRKRIAQKIGMLQQHTVYVFDSSVLQTALTGRHPHLSAWERESARDTRLAREALASVGMAELADRSVTRLSGGEARRLAFATLMVQNPDLMLLDEPTNHLDFRHQVRVMRTVGDMVYGSGRLALTALHDVNLAAMYCSHVLMLFGDGEWLGGPAVELLTNENLERLYQCPVSAIDTPEGRRFHPAFSRLSD